MAYSWCRGILQKFYPTEILAPFTTANTQAKVVSVPNTTFCGLWWRIHSWRRCKIDTFCSLTHEYKGKVLALIACASRVFFSARDKVQHVRAWLSCNCMSVGIFLTLFGKINNPHYFRLQSSGYENDQVHQQKSCVSLW